MLMRRVQIAKHTALIQQGCASYFTTSSNEQTKLGSDDIGKLYSVPMASMLKFKINIPSLYLRQIQTLREGVWLYREHTHKAFKCFHEAYASQAPAIRIVLWGKFGTGKSITLNQIIQLAYSQGYVIFTVKDAMQWNRDNYREVQVSTYKPGRINSPFWASRLLKSFKYQNSLSWDKLAELKTTKNYKWSKVESTSEGKPLTDIIEMGLTAPYLATDCLGALCRELRVHASNGSIKLFVAIDKANGLYGKAVVKRLDRTTATSDELALNIHIRKFLMPIWSNGLCAMVADKAEISDSRNFLSIPVNDPRTLFGDKGYEQIEPFISVETKSYSEEEFNVMHNYFLEKNWICQEEGPRGEEAKRQIKYLSALNPFNYERLCASNWKFGCCVPVVSNC